MTKAKYVSLALCSVVAMCQAWLQSPRCVELSRGSVLETVGGVPCNHKDKFKWCTTGTFNCSGACQEVNVDCAQSANHQIHATTGSIYLCGTPGSEEDQINCDTASGNQQCQQDETCRCLRGLNLVKACEKVGWSPEYVPSEQNIVVDTNCQL